MKIREYIEIFEIISKYFPKGLDYKGGFLTAEHDQIYLHLTTEQVDEDSEDGQRFIELGLNIENGTWYIYV